MDKNTGTLKWKTKWKGIPFWSTDIVGAGNTVICSDILNISSFSAKDGTLLWNVHFQDLVEHDWKKPCPAMADGIIVVGGKESSNNLIALASNPYLFVKQGDAFLEKGESEKALTSYMKAQQLYEKKGSPRTQEIQKKIQEIQKSPSTPEQSEPPPEQSEPPPESPISPSPVQSNPLILLSVVVGVLVGVLLTYYLLVTRIRNK